MEKILVLMAVFSLLFIASCQKSERVDPKDGLTNEQDNPSGFKLFGDPRDPAEFMSLEKIKLIQDGFKTIKGRNLKNQVYELPETKAAVFPLGAKWYLHEQDIPILKIDDKALYISVIMIYDESDNTFSTSVSYILGTENNFYSRGWYSENNTEVYHKNDLIILMEEECKFEVELTDHPQYAKAIVTFINPIQMDWNRKEQRCGIVLLMPTAEVTYQ